MFLYPDVYNYLSNRVTQSILNFKVPGKAIEPNTRTQTHTRSLTHFSATPFIRARPSSPAVQIEDGKSIYGILSLAEPTTRICLAMTTTETMPQQQQQQDDTNHREMPQRRPEQTEVERERERGKRTWRELKHMQTKVNQSILELTNCVKQYYE